MKQEKRTVKNLINGTAAELFYLLRGFRGWWDGYVLAVNTETYCMSTYMHDVDEWLARPSCPYHRFRVERRRNPKDRKHWQYRLIKRHI